VSFLGDLEGILDPGGDPAAVHGAATACRTLASDLRATASALDSTAADLEKSWKGIGGREDESASAAFQRAWSKFSTAIVEYAEQLDVAATRIDDIADAIQTAQAEAAKLKDTIEITVAGGALLTIFSFGVSDATADAMAAADLAVAAGAMSEFGAFLANSVALLSDITDALVTVGSQFALGVVSDSLAIMATKPFEGLNPFSISSYDANDLTNVLLGGLVSGAMGALVNGVGPVTDFMGAHPVAGAALWNTTASTAWLVPWEFWILGQPFDLHTSETFAENAGISFLSAGGFGKLGTMGGLPGQILGAEGETGIPGVTKADVVNNGVVFPVSMLKYALFGGPRPVTLPAPQAGSAPVPNVPMPQVPGLPPGTPVPQVPPHIGGGTETVASGDTLWDIAGRRLGNPNLYPVIAKENLLPTGPDATLEPGQVLRIPVLPPSPAGSIAQVVQPGQSLSEIAGGNPELAQRIAELNNVKDPSLIYTGQVLIVPPAG
jgi:uncharacterized protein YukE